jgi:hypothetical protein
MRTQLSFAVLFVAVFASVPAQAQRVFVSATGSDGNPCSFASPCRSFQHAHNVAPAGGEINVLDPAGYGAVTITKAISIQGHGFSGITVASGGIGITINASSTDAVHLNGLLIEGDHAGNNGILFNSGASLTVENSIVRNMTNDGLAFESTATTSQTLAVSNSYINDNGGYGIYISTGNSGAVMAVIDRTGLYGDAVGGLFVFGTPGVTGSPTVAVTDSIAANGGCGFCVLSDSSGPTSNLSLTHALSEGNATGVSADGVHGFIWLAQSTITGNLRSFFASPGGSTIFTYLDNYIAAANGPPLFGTLTTVGKQ